MAPSIILQWRENVKIYVHPSAKQNHFVYMKIYLNLEQLRKGNSDYSQIPLKFTNYPPTEIPKKSCNNPENISLTN